MRDYPPELSTRSIKFSISGVSRVRGAMMVLLEPVNALRAILSLSIGFP
jgi:hypothetical protein